MSHDPASLSRETLPRYACPDLTNRPGFWAKALPERLARFGSVLSFRFTLTGDVLFAVDGDEKGVFFTGISTKSPLWALIDVYGNTSCVEFVGKPSHFHVFLCRQSLKNCFAIKQIGMCSM